VPTAAKKQRLDLLLVDRDLVESREQARRLIMAGEVLVDGRVSDKPGRAVPVDADVQVRSLPRYVSRGGLKLEAALADCLLQHGAARVYAIDVGYGQLAWSLRTDPRVVVMERTNIRHVTALPDGVLADVAVIDASFISLELVLPPTLNLLVPAGEVVALIKPQFEAGRDDVGKGGVVRDGKVHRRVITETAAFAQSLGLTVTDLTVSPAPGPAGNVEFLIRLTRTQARPLDLEQATDRVLERAASLQKKGKIEE
jgi:23S rRNA (cytidine1920-2'-O)/16S rRNA (cytidine1409-2'-O)-methyltransferase